jgi:lipopolysaccharide biosynthesis glycosyltransferase
MKINICTVSNGSYFPFLEIWLRSLFDVVDLDNINKIYIIDTGLTDEQRNFVSLYPKTSFYNTNLSTKFVELHDENWGKSNYSKLPAIKNIIERDDSPIVFIDCDSVFQKDFYELLDFKKEIVVCNTMDRKGAFSTKYIGSFYGFLHGKDSFGFIDKWHDIILNSSAIKTKWRESPSLTILLDSLVNKSELIQELKESIISNSLYSPNKESAYIFHLKSDKLYGYDSVETRIKMPPANQIIKARRYV